jgi:hypothetical protein
MIGRVSGRGGDPPKMRKVTQYQVESQPAVWLSGEPAGELDHGFDTKDPPKRHAGRHCWRRLANAAEMLCFDKVESKLVEEPVR